jgi:hypothetical protein
VFISIKFRRGFKISLMASPTKAIVIRHAAPNQPKKLHTNAATKVQVEVNQTPSEQQ